MHHVENDAQKSAPAESGEQVATAYLDHYEVLEYIVLHRFHIPEDDVRGVIHEVFLAFIRNRARIRDYRTWLVGATFIQCRQYWRVRGREETLEPLDDEFDPASAADDIATRVEVSSVLRQLSTRCRQLLHLRFFEEYSSEEIARQFDTTVDYARKLVHQCVGNARTLFARMRRQA